MSQAKAIPERSQIAPEYTWNTADLYPTDQAWQEDFSRLQAMVPKLAACAGRLGESADALYAYVTLEQEAGELLVKLMDYAQRRSDEDTRVPEYQAMVGKITSQYVALSQAVSFEIPEVLRIPTQTLERFYGEKPELELYRRYFTIIQDRREHTLSDAEEKLLAGVGELAQAPDDIFSKLADADLTFPDAVDGKGEKHPLSNGSYTLLMASEDRALRKSAFENLYAVYGGVKNTMAATLSAQVKQLQFFAAARKYPSALAASLDGTRVPEAVYHNLISTVRANLDKMHRYVRLRKKLLGVDELHMYDVYAPMVSGVDAKIPYEEAKETVYQAVAPLGKEYQAIIREGLDNRWIDVYENVGKRSGGLYVRLHGPPLYPLKLPGRFGRHVHPGPRAGPRGPLLSVQQDAAHRVPGLCDLRGRGGLHLQRGPAHGASAEKHHGQAPPGLAHQPLPGAVQGHPVPADHVRRV